MNTNYNFPKLLPFWPLLPLAILAGLAGWAAQGLLRSNAIPTTYYVPVLVGICLPSIAFGVYLVLFALYYHRYWEFDSEVNERMEAAIAYRRNSVVSALCSSEFEAATHEALAQAWHNERAL